MTPPFANTQEMVTWLRKKLVREVIQQWLGTNGLEQLEAIADTLEAQQWQPMETAPKDGRYVLLSDGRTLCDVGIWMPKREAQVSALSGFVERMAIPEGWFNGPRCRVKPTHWMPLPAPPATPEAQS